MRYAMAVLIFLLSATSVSAQSKKYYVVLFDADYSKIADNRGNLKISVPNLYMIELNTNSAIVNLNKEVLAVIVEEIMVSYTLPGVMSTRILNFASETELEIKLNSWKTLMVQEHLINGDVYSTFYGKIRERNRVVWKEVRKIKVR